MKEERGRKVEKNGSEKDTERNKGEGMRERVEAYLALVVHEERENKRDVEADLKHVVPPDVASHVLQSTQGNRTYQTSPSLPHSGELDQTLVV